MSRVPTRVLAALLVVVASPVFAVDGQTPIPFTAPVTTPITITTPGSYVVTRNLTPTGPGPLLSIAVGGTPGDVQIDLNGMILDNTANPGFPVIQVLVGAASEATIRNGTLIGGAAGIEAVGPSRKVVVEDVKISDFTAAGPPAGIFLLDVLNYVIRRNVIIDTDTTLGPGGPGIWIDGGIPRQGTIEDNLIRRTLDGIVFLPLGSSVEISNNRILEILPGGPFGAAINLDAAFTCLLTQNTIDSTIGPPPAVGIRLNFSTGCKVYNNVVGNVAEWGIFLSPGADDNLILENVVRGAALDGLYVDGDRNHIDRNVLNSNGGYGLHFGPGAVDNTFGRNTAVGNGGGPCAFPFSPDLCDDFAPPGLANVSFGDNLVPPAAGLF